MRVLRNGQQGFTLVELMVVVVIMGLVIGSIYSMYTAQLRAAYSQGEVVDVQQNLRVAMDSLSRDIRMAGVMIAAGPNQTFAAPTGSPAFPNYSTSVRINTASAEGRFARVAATYTVPAGATSVPLTVEAPPTASAPNVVDGFAVGDTVRVIRPVDAGQYLSGGGEFVISAKDRATPGLTIERPDHSTLTEGDNVIAGDMIAKVAPGSSFPPGMQVDYYLANGGTTVSGYTCPANQKCLVRRVNGDNSSAQIIATELTSLRFSYLNDSYSEETAPTDFTKIRAVRVTLQGATSKTTAMSGGAKPRSISTIVKLRNRR